MNRVVDITVFLLFFFCGCHSLGLPGTDAPPLPEKAAMPRQCSAVVRMRLAGVSWNVILANVNGNLTKPLTAIDIMTMSPEERVACLDRHWGEHGVAHLRVGPSGDVYDPGQHGIPWDVTPAEVFNYLTKKVFHITPYLRHMPEQSPEFWEQPIKYNDTHEMVIQVRPKNVPAPIPVVKTMKLEKPTPETADKLIGISTEKKLESHENPFRQLEWTTVYITDKGEWSVSSGWIAKDKLGCMYEYKNCECAFSTSIPRHPQSDWNIVEYGVYPSSRYAKPIARYPNDNWFVPESVGCLAGSKSADTCASERFLAICPRVVTRYLRTRSVDAVVHKTMETKCAIWWILNRAAALLTTKEDIARCVNLEPS